MTDYLPVTMGEEFLPSVQDDEFEVLPVVPEETYTANDDFSSDRFHLDTYSSIRPYHEEKISVTPFEDRFSMEQYREIVKPGAYKKESPFGDPDTWGDAYQERDSEFTFSDRLAQDNHIHRLYGYVAERMSEWFYSFRMGEDTSVLLHSIMDIIEEIYPDLMYCGFLDATLSTLPSRNRFTIIETDGSYCEQDPLSIAVFVVNPAYMKKFRNIQEQDDISTIMGLIDINRRTEELLRRLNAYRGHDNFLGTSALDAIFKYTLEWFLSPENASFRESLDHVIRIVNGYNECLCSNSGIYDPDEYIKEQRDASSCLLCKQVKNNLTVACVNKKIPEYFDSCRTQIAPKITKVTMKIKGINPGMYFVCADCVAKYWHAINRTPTHRLQLGR